MGIISTHATTPRLIRTTNTTDASYPTRAWRRGRDNPPTNSTANASQTSNAAILKPAQIDSEVGPNAIELMLHGTDAANETIVAAVRGWQLIEDGSDPNLWLWRWKTLLEVTGTLSTFTGTDLTIMTSSQFICDTIEIVGTAGNSNSYSIISPADNTPASVIVDIRGSRLIEVVFKLGTGASCNGTYNWIY